MKLLSFKMENLIMDVLNIWLLVVVADCKVISISTPHQRATERDKMAYGKDYGRPFMFLGYIFCDIHIIFPKGKYCLYKSSQCTVPSLQCTAFG